MARKTGVPTETIPVRAHVEHIGPRTDFLVVGSFASTGWAHGNYGSKIEAAVRYRAAGHGIKIISETHWQQFAAAILEKLPPPSGGIIIEVQ